jgi:peroxiredoxin
MSQSVSIGDGAPNFDLSSTESVVLMLRDELGRTALVLYFFADGQRERVRRDLEALNARSEKLAKMRTRILGISPAKMDDLKTLQGDLQLRFPLLRDDRGISRAYGAVASEEGESSPPLMAVVDQKQRIRWLANPVTSVEGAMPQVEKILKGLPSSTASYPGSVLNRWVDRWVN